MHHTAKKYKFITLLLTAWVAIGFLLPQPGLTADFGPVAIVDLKKILDESLATKSIRQQIETKRDAVQTEVSKQEEALRKEDKSLAEQRSVLSQEAFEKKQKAFGQKVLNVQKDVQTKRAQLEKAYGKALSEVQQVVLAIVTELSDKKGFNVVIPKAQTLFAAESIDISSEVLKTLNDRLKNVKVVVE